MSGEPSDGAGTETVLLLHGLARSGRSFGRLARRLEVAGYRPWALSYPSRRMPLPALVDWVAERIVGEHGGGPIRAVTHSLGGIVVRLLADRFDWRGLVMVAPPNRGSRIARMMGDSRLFRLSHGPVGPAIATPEGWPDPPRPFAVIAGTRRLALGNPTSWFARATGVLPADLPSDGTVAVEETRLPTMSDFATVDACHTWILDHPETAELVLRFFAGGSFAL